MMDLGGALHVGSNRGDRRYGTVNLIHLDRLFPLSVLRHFNLQVMKYTLDHSRLAIYYVLNSAARQVIVELLQHFVV